MAVLIEGISVVVRCKEILDRYQGAQPAFINDVPNKTLCADGELAAVSFMTPADAQEYVRLLEDRGLRFLHEGAPLDIAVVDQYAGVLRACDWVIFGGADWNNLPSCPVRICQFYRTKSDQIVAPAGWSYEDSLTARGRHVSADQFPSSLKFLRTDNGLDVYLDEETQEEFYVRRN